MTFLICSLYRPPSADSDYLDLIFNNIEYATSFNDNIIITGDLKIDYCNEKGPNFKWLKQLENTFNMEQLVYTPTRVTPSSSTIIDHILTSVPDLHIATGVLPYCSSDHFLVYTTLSLSAPKPKHKYSFKRDFKHFNESNFITDIKESSYLNGSIIPTDVDTAWSLWKDTCTFINISNKHAPIKRVRIKNIKNPWFNENIQNMIYERNHYHQKFLKTKENEY